ncbi:hypothetical protein [Intrasporangium sp.]|jgi:hypothetical protein|uniref:hypothetical protein n=1 Tax=Intrasporangium sp. TaxID=1925024 RepID=UPI0033659E03
MSQHTTGPTYGSLPDTDLPETGPTYSTGSTSSSGSTTEAAKHAARETTETAKGEAHHLADTAKSELGNVASTATDQIRRLMDQSRSELTEQARSQQQRLATNLRTLTDELDSMAAHGDQQGVAHGLVRQVSQQARTLGDWLDGREPGAVLDEVKRFARRKPGTFLALAAGLGLLSGRMTRGLKAASQDEDSQSYRANGYTAYGTPAYPAETTYPTQTTVVDGPLATTGTTAGYATSTESTAGYPTSTQTTADYPASTESLRGDAR